MSYTTLISSKNYELVVKVWEAEGKPQQNKDAVLRCIDRFADAYIKTLTDNRDKLCYRDVIDFDHCFGN